VEEEEEEEEEDAIAIRHMDRRSSVVLARGKYSSFLITLPMVGERSEVAWSWSLGPWSINMWI
jgi:hypothetical protein